jgi:hypothetical protein
MCNVNAAINAGATGSVRRVEVGFRDASVSWTHRISGVRPVVSLEGHTLGPPPAGRTPETFSVPAPEGCIAQLRALGSLYEIAREPIPPASTVQGVLLRLAILGHLSTHGTAPVDMMPVYEALGELQRANGLVGTGLMNSGTERALERLLPATPGAPSGVPWYGTKLMDPTAPSRFSLPSVLGHRHTGRGVEQHAGDMAAIVPARFAPIARQTPDLHEPDFDPQLGVVVVHEKTIRVLLRRSAMDHTAPVRLSNPAGGSFSVPNAGTDLPPGRDVVVEIHGDAVSPRRGSSFAADSLVAQTPDGVVLTSLAVTCRPLVRIRVLLRDAMHTTASPRWLLRPIDLAAVTATVNAIWGAAGIAFDISMGSPVTPVFNDPRGMKGPRAPMLDSSELGAFAGFNVPGVVNLYRILAFAPDAEPGLMGLTDEAGGAIVVADEMPSRAAAFTTPMELGQTIAHELGHFLTLRHFELIPTAAELSPAMAPPVPPSPIANLSLMYPAEGVLTWRRNGWRIPAPSGNDAWIAAEAFARRYP